VEVVLDTARDGDQQQPGGLGHGPEPVRAPTGQEDKTARCGAERVAAAADGQLAVQDIEALILAIVDMQWRPGPTLVSKTVRAPSVDRCDAFRPGTPARPTPAGTT
jgi:hypothetical protein